MVSSCQFSDVRFKILMIQIVRCCFVFNCFPSYFCSCSHLSQEVHLQKVIYYRLLRFDFSDPLLRCKYYMKRVKQCLQVTLLFLNLPCLQYGRLMEDSSLFQVSQLMLLGCCEIQTGSYCIRKVCGELSLVSWNNPNTEGYECLYQLLEQSM